MPQTERFDYAEALARVRKGSIVANNVRPWDTFMGTREYGDKLSVCRTRFSCDGRVVDRSYDRGAEQLLSYGFSYAPKKGWYEVENSYSCDPKTYKLKKSEGGSVSFDGVVYLVWQEGSDLFKIGYSKNGGKDRVKDLSTGNPNKLHVVGERPGDLQQEKALKDFYLPYQHDREWFNFRGAVLSEVGRLFGVEV